MSGAGAATLSQFAARRDPVGPKTFDSTGRFLDLAASPRSQLTGATLSICGAAAARELYWWDAAAGSWKPLTPPAQLTANPIALGTSPCLTASLSGSSSLSLSQLGSAVLGLGRPS